MRRCRSTRCTLVAALAMTAAGTGVLAAEAKQEKAAAPDLCGTWRLDTSRSDASPFAGPSGPRSTARGSEDTGDPPPPPPDGGPLPGVPCGEPLGEPGGRPPGAPSPAGPPGGGRMRLPDLLRIETHQGVVRFADSTGALVQEIDPAAAPARWQDDQLVVESRGRRGPKLTRTYALEDSGQTLVIRTRVDPGGDQSPRDTKRVYRKAGS